MMRRNTKRRKGTQKVTKKGSEVVEAYVSTLHIESIHTVVRKTGQFHACKVSHSSATPLPIQLL